MADATLGTVLRHFRRLSDPRLEAGRSDADLLHCFLSLRDQDAFTALVRRHGPMVLGVCRRVLRHQQDAEDAFQATFLALARKAGSVRQSSALAGWLHGAAYRAALTIRRSAARRRDHESRVEPLSSSGPSAELAWREVQALLEDEIQRLPEIYRMAFVLCCLEAQPRAEVARRLGVAEGTVSSRLDHARKTLLERLARRGVSLSAVLAADQVARTAVLPPLFAAATRTALGGLQSSAAGRLKLIAALGLTMGAIGAGLLARPAAEDRPAPLKASAAAGAPAGDPLPPGALARLGTMRLRHGSTVTGLAFAPDGKTLVSASYDMTVRVWDSAAGKELLRLPPISGSAYDLSLSANGKAVAVVGYNLVYVGEPKAGGLRPFALPRLESRSFATLSPDGKTLAAQSAQNAVGLWDVATGKQRLDCRGHSGRVKRAAFAPDGKALASCGEDGAVRLWDVQTGKETLLLQRKQAVNAVAFSADGRLLATGGEDGRLCLWQLPAGKMLHELHLTPLGIGTVVLSPDGKTVVVSGNRNLIHLVDAATGKASRRLGDNPEAIAISPDSLTLASGGHNSAIRLWDVATGKERHLAEGHSAPIRSMAVAADGTVATCGGDDFLRLWDPASGKQLRQINTRSAVSPLALSPDGKVVTANYTIWDRASGKELGRFKGWAGHHRVAFSPDGKSVATASMYGDAGKGDIIRIWDATTFAERRHFGSVAVHALSYAPDGKSLASGDQDGVIRFWDAATGREARTIAGHKRDINSLEFSPDGKALASGSFDGDLFLWDVASRKQLRPLRREVDPRGGGAHVLAVAFSPNGKMLASAERPMSYREGDLVTLWEVATGRIRMRLAGHQGYVDAVAFARDGRTIVSGSSDTTALVWDVLGPPRDSRKPEATWDDLLGEEAARAYRVMCDLARHPGGAKFLGDHLPPAPAPDGPVVARLIKDLDSDVFDRRDRAGAELEKLGETAEAAMRKALAALTSLEPRRRLERILAKLDPEWLRTQRAVEALELAGTPAAKAVLQSLAAGVPEARLTREAKAALERWSPRRSASLEKR